MARQESPRYAPVMLAAIAVLFIACAIAGGFIGHQTRHAVDGVFMGLLTGPLGVIALWFCRADNWS